jgi:hypothetical protein
MLAFGCHRYSSVSASSVFGGPLSRDRLARTIGRYRGKQFEQGRSDLIKTIPDG